MIRKTLTVLASAMAVATIIGCAHDKSAAVHDDSGMPSFVLNPPVEAGKLYGTGIAKKESPQLARDIADLNAKTEIAKILGQKISNLTKQFMQESGVSTPEATEFSESVTKSVTDQNLVGCQIVKRDQKNGSVYSLAVLNLTDPEVKKYIADAVTKSLAGKDALLSEFRAKQGFEDLDKELDKLQNKNDAGINSAK